MTEQTPEQTEWPLLPWLLAAIGGVAGFLIYSIGGGNGPGTTVGWQAAATALFFFGPLAFGFTVERNRWKEPLAFAALVGLVMGGLAWRAVAAGDSYARPEFGFLAGVLATGLALALFQSGFHRTRFATPYKVVHRNAWADAICAAGSLAFVGASWLLLVVLSELFHLLKIEFIRNLMQDGWFAWTWSGVAFGAALGVLRNEAGILGTLQRVVMTVLSILAVPLALGLALFLVAMIVSGPDVLWAATRNATPILLLCAAGAWVLANAIVRDSDSEMSGNRVLGWAAMVLVLVVLPLTAFAAVSLGLRVAQHGLSPERIWGMIAIGVACAYGLAWFVAVVRGWKGGVWRERVRRANLLLAAVICVVAFVLALPIVDFGAVSARNQLARLESGAVSADDFDYAALRWDFGDAGRRALARLARSKDTAIAQAARDTQAMKQRPYGAFGVGGAKEFDLRMQPADPTLERQVRQYLRTNPWMCEQTCVAVDAGLDRNGNLKVAIVSGGGYQSALFNAQGGEPNYGQPAKPAEPLTKDSKVEIRTVGKRYIFVDGTPRGPSLDEE